MSDKSQMEHSIGADVRELDRRVAELDRTLANVNEWLATAEDFPLGEIRRSKAERVVAEARVSIEEELTLLLRDIPREYAPHVWSDAAYAAPRKVNHPASREIFDKPEGESAEILARIQTWAGGAVDALFWYHSQPIAAFGDRTAEELVKSGHASALRDYLDAIALGGFA